MLVRFLNVAVTHRSFIILGNAVFHCINISFLLALLLVNIYVASSVGAVMYSGVMYGVAMNILVMSFGKHMHTFLWILQSGIGASCISETMFSKVCNFIN